MREGKRKGHPVGPGNTFWFTDEDGELMRCRWNDPGWVTRTFVHLPERGRCEIEQVIREAYEAGMRDQLTIVQNTLGISREGRVGG